MISRDAPSFLVIRRDNIGDLVCTTPLFHALRERFPASRICALVNSYNRPVLENNPDIDAIFAYTKAKHREQNEGVFAVYWNRVRTILALRRMHFDYAILAASGYEPRSLRLARLIRPTHILGFVPAEAGVNPHIDLPVAHSKPRPPHEAQDVFEVLSPLGIRGEPGSLRVYPDPVAQADARAVLYREPTRGSEPLFGVHISARKPSQQWPADRFVDLIQELRACYRARVALFWSPGSQSNPLHPGDDEKANQILESLGETVVVPFPTANLTQLIAGLSLCELVICSDGGAMHLAAGLGKPILCFFGKSSLAHWHPWRVPYVALQPTSEDVVDVSVADALAGLERLRTQTRAAGSIPLAGQLPSE